MKKNKITSIAIADDSPFFRKGLKYSINSFDNYAVDIEANDGIELIEKIDSTDKLPDICVLDVSMPRLDGYETLRHLHKTWPDIKVMMLSMHYNEYAIIKSFQTGASAYLPKEISDLQLFEALNSIIEKGYYQTELANEFMTLQVLKKGINTNLSEKEIEFLRYACSDLNYKQIADIMNVSHRTIDTYRDNLFKKLNVTTRSALVVFAMQSGIYPTYNTLAS